MEIVLHPFVYEYVIALPLEEGGYDNTTVIGRGRSAGAAFKRAKDSITLDYRLYDSKTGRCIGSFTHNEHGWRLKP